jgi:glycosyltransferase involved in cell wall biosynthesis
VSCGDSSNRTPQSLVSVGIPTYNRPQGLRRTLECITRQTYPHLEILVSDNASPGRETEHVTREFMTHDHRIQFYKQPENRGPLFNFQFVLEKASGEYFMWAADDDAWDAEFVATLMRQFELSDSSIVAIASEAQYTLGGKPQPFFREGAPFYSDLYDSAFERVRHMLLFNYGNLFYSIFKKSSLSKNGRTVFDLFKTHSLNEIPIFIKVAESGNWKVLPEVLLYKEAPHRIYLQAKWEMAGGPGPRKTWRHPFSLIKSAGYHWAAFNAIRESISQLESVTHREQKYLTQLARKLLMRHYYQLVANRKSSGKFIKSV